MKQSRYNVWADAGDARYVYNGITGTMVRVAAADADAVERFVAGDSGSGAPAKALEELTRARMLVKDDTDELETLKVRYQLTRYDPHHLGLTMVTSLGCNFDCPYCFEAKHPSIMSAEVEAAVLRLVDDSLPNLEDLHVTWFGGEPLVGKKPLLSLSDAFIERCDAHGVEYSADIITNGWHLDDQTCRELAERRVTEAQVTIDGPPDIHDRMRPLAGGKPTFWRIVKNLHNAVRYLNVVVRVNVDTGNMGRVEELLRILDAEGLAGRIGVYIGQLIDASAHADAPSATYTTACFSKPEFAKVEREFAALAHRYGFGPETSLPSPSGTPCTAVRANEIVVGSEGELYKCWEEVGEHGRAIGNIRDYADSNGRLRKWLAYDPFANQECRSCIALPVCMGGCAHHAMNLLQYENRCGTFRHTYKEQVLAAATVAEATGRNPYSTPVKLSRRTETR